MNKENFIVLGLQALLVGMLLVSFARFFIETNLFIALQAVLSVVYFILLLYFARKEFREQFFKFLVFFGVLWVFAQLSWFVSESITGSGADEMNYLFGMLFLLVLFFAGFKIVGAKSHTKARVLSSDGNITVVETGFDLMSFNKGGKHVIETAKKFNPGKEVKVRLSQGGLLKKKAKIIE